MEKSNSKKLKPKITKKDAISKIKEISKRYPQGLISKIETDILVLNKIIDQLGNEDAQWANSRYPDDRDDHWKSFDGTWEYHLIDALDTLRGMLDVKHNFTDAINQLIEEIEEEVESEKEHSKKTKTKNNKR